MVRTPTGCSTTCAASPARYLAGGDYTATDYSHMPEPANPAGQYIETRRPAPHPTSDDDDWSNPATINGTADQIWSRAFLDGFGRKWRERSEAPGSDQIAIDRIHVQQYGTEPVHAAGQGNCPCSCSASSRRSSCS